MDIFGRKKIEDLEGHLIAVQRAILAAKESIVDRLGACPWDDLVGNEELLSPDLTLEKVKQIIRDLPL